MKNILYVIAGLGLLGTIAPPALYLLGAVDVQPMKVVMAVATAAWFASAPLLQRPDA
jgi:hypothetical protein